MKYEYNIKVTNKEINKIKEILNKNEILYYSYKDFLCYKNNVKNNFLIILNKEIKNIKTLDYRYLDNKESILCNNVLTLFISFKNKDNKEILSIEIIIGDSI